jgi:hypothetical protein
MLPLMGRATAGACYGAPSRAYSDRAPRNRPFGSRSDAKPTRDCVVAAARRSAGVSLVSHLDVDRDFGQQCHAVAAWLLAPSLAWAACCGTSRTRSPRLRTQASRKRSSTDSRSSKFVVRVARRRHREAQVRNGGLEVVHEASHTPFLVTAVVSNDAEQCHLPASLPPQLAVPKCRRTCGRSSRRGCRRPTKRRRRRLKIILTHLTNALS